MLLGLHAGVSMRRVTPDKLFLQVLWILTVSAFALKAYAGIRAPGKYCGVVVFDRWGTCFLLSGPYITYISDRVKNELIPYKGSAIQIDASDVLQPVNPGDALIQKYKIIGPAPLADHPPSVEGLELIAQSDFGAAGTPTFLIAIHNTGNKPVEVFSNEVAPTVLGTNQGDALSWSRFLSLSGWPSPSDGISVAWITRMDLALLRSGKREWVRNQFRCSLFYADSNAVLQERFMLQPGQSKSVRIAVELPSGEYQFIVGYGGGVHEAKSLSSNAISFDINGGGVATLAN
jgi:hypothetical protein